MPEGIPYASTNVIAGTGLDLNYVGNRVYAYSGGIPLNNETKTALEFQTGNKTIKAKVQHTGRFSVYGSSKSIEIIISMNNVQVIRYSTSSNAAHAPLDIDPLHIIIPPYTAIKIEVATNDTQDLDNFVTLTGKMLV